MEIALHKHKMQRECAKLLTEEQDRFEKTIEAIVKVLGKILSVSDPLSYEFGQKLKEYTHACIEALKLEHGWDLETAAALARIGYVTMPAILIQKVRAGMVLTTSERDMVTHLPEAGRNILNNFARLENVGKIVYYQNKNFDGAGFPVDSIGGVNIPMGSRLLRILADIIQSEADGTSKGKAIDKLKATSGLYDLKLLQDVTVALSSGPKKGRPIHLKHLCVGQTLVEAIETADGTLILNAGNRITPWMLKKLNNFVEMSGVKEPIYVED
ncbi:MAG: hypothetical protein FJ403_23525 [Verrucomicrobia bacterium]|nr:hypothetical protein [Verrucomicrobiota bacterium]